MLRLAALLATFLTTSALGAPGDLPLPARLDPLTLPPEVELLPAQPLARLLIAGQLERAQAALGAFRYANPGQGPRPLMHLIQRIYELSLRAEVDRGRWVHVVRAPGRGGPIDHARLGDWYRDLGRALLGQDPPAAVVHVVEGLGGGFHGLHFAGQLAVTPGSAEVTARHELVHALLAIHPAASILNGELFWLNEGIAELLSRQEDPRLVLRPPLASEVPATLAELFPQQEGWRGDPGNPDLGYLGALVAARRLLGEDPMATATGRGRLAALARLGGETAAARALPAVFGTELRAFEAGWREAFREEMAAAPEHALPEDPRKRPWETRRAILGKALSGKLRDAVRMLAGVELGEGELPGWYVADAIRFGTALAKRGAPGDRLALAALYRKLPHVGLAVPPPARDPLWGRAVLERLLAGDPDERELLHLTLSFWGSPWRGDLERAWKRQLAAHGTEPAWVLAQVMREAFRGRLEPPPGGFEETHATIEALLPTEPALEGIDLQLVRGYREARAAYAFGAGKYAAAARVLEGQIRADGPRARTLMNLGAARFYLGELEAARAHFEQALFLDPDFPGVRLALGAVLLDLGEPGAAARVLEAALALPHDRERLLGTLSKAARALGKKEDAERLRKEALGAGWDPEGRPVPAEFRAMVYSTLDAVLGRP